MKKILVVVDMQNDFITGSLGSEYAKNTVLPNVVKKIKDCKDYVIFTQDTHREDYLETLEGQKLPITHCIKNTQGWELAPEIKAAYDSLDSGKKECITKTTFGCLNLIDEASLYATGPAKNYEFEIVGLCTDICVVSNALILRAQFPNIKITCDASCCGGTSKEAHDAALKVMENCQINVIGR